MAEERPEPVLLGRNLSEIPCFRSSLLYGIMSGVAAGMGYFLYSSKPKKSSNIAVFTFTGTTLVYWFYCRYHWSQARFNMSKLKAAMQEHTLYEGTEKEKRTS